MSSTPASPAPGWSGRTDGETPEHLRWHQVVRPASGLPDDGSVAPASDVASPAPSRSTALIGFASDEGVRRNRGRIGASEGPSALRAALSPLSYRASTGALTDHGDVVVPLGDEEHPGDLEDGQAALGERISGLLDAHDLTVVLGGGHETAYASYRGLVGSRHVGQDTRIGILNLDAHFDLREEAMPTSGTPFLQALEDEAVAGRTSRYAVVGISEPNNTEALFQTAREHTVRWVCDEQAQTGDLPNVLRFVRELIDAVDVLYLTVDLDVLPAAIAPGVSAPAGFGVPYAVVHACVSEAAASGKLVLADVVELNPSLDVDGRTAKAAARLIHTLVDRHRPVG
jgi:formiminoglutamase